MNPISLNRETLTQYLRYARRSAAAEYWAVSQLIAALRHEYRVRAVQLAAAGATAQELWCGGYSGAEIDVAAKVVAEDLRPDWRKYTTASKQCVYAEFELDDLLMSFQLVA